MKKGLVFILGILIGIILTILFAIIWSSYHKDDEDIAYFDSPKEFTVSDEFEIFQVLEYGALAQSRKTEYKSNIYGDPIVLILPKEQNNFYDNEIIAKAPNSKIMQIGTFKYSSKMGERVVPVIEFRSTNNGVDDEIVTWKTSDQTSSRNTDGEITYAEQQAPFNVAKNFKVKDVLNNGVIAECKDKTYSSIDLYGDPIIYIPAEGQNMYYNDQIITVPAGKKAVQVGTIRRYSSVYPIIEFQ
ncbi:MAG: hypothetical protein K2I89_11540 [Muribaculaceae bacterium]|nr:hypothetical protein [Muribaculaceae bacterium]